MAVRVKRGKADPTVKAIKGALARYGSDHPRAQVDLYRINPGSIRVRVVDPRFHRVNRTNRHALVWSYLEELDTEIVDEIGWLLLLSPQEAKSSLASAEFDNPAPAFS